MTREKAGGVEFEIRIEAVYLDFGHRWLQRGSEARQRPGICSQSDGLSGAQADADAPRADRALGTGASPPVGTLDGLDVTGFQGGDNRQRGEEVLIPGLRNRVTGDALTAPAAVTDIWRAAPAITCPTEAPVSFSCCRGQVSAG